MKANASLPKDDDDDDATVQRRISANGAGRPQTNAPNSVFDAGRKAKADASPPRPAASDIVIRKGVEKPAARGTATGIYLDVIRKMQPTDSVELALKHAKSFYARAKEHGLSTTPPQRFSFRKLSDTTGAVWRDA